MWQESNTSSFLKYYVDKRGDVLNKLKVWSGNLHAVCVCVYVWREVEYKASWVGNIAQGPPSPIKILRFMLKVTVTYNAPCNNTLHSRLQYAFFSSEHILLHEMN